MNSVDSRPYSALFNVPSRRAVAYQVVAWADDNNAQFIKLNGSPIDSGPDGGPQRGVIQLELLAPDGLEEHLARAVKDASLLPFDKCSPVPAVELRFQLCGRGQTWLLPMLATISPLSNIPRFDCVWSEVNLRSRAFPPSCDAAFEVTTTSLTEMQVLWEQICTIGKSHSLELVTERSERGNPLVTLLRGEPEVMELAPSSITHALGPRLTAEELYRAELRRSQSSA